MTPEDRTRADKLYAMLTSPFKQEAATARRKLEKLLAKYGMTVAAFKKMLAKEAADKAAKEKADQEAAQAAAAAATPPITIPQAHIDALASYLAAEVHKEHGDDISHNTIAMARLKQAAEEAIFKLFSATVTRISLPFLAHDRQGKPIEFVY